jgi:hypothetical protein
MLFSTYCFTNFSVITLIAVIKQGNTLKYLNKTMH